VFSFAVIVTWLKFSPVSGFAVSQSCGHSIVQSRLEVIEKVAWLSALGGKFIVERDGHNVDMSS
jgi:hypothetical protein